MHTDHPRMGRLLLSLPCQKALPSTGWLDRPKTLVAPHQAVAERSLEGIPDETAAHRVQAGRAGLTDPFASGRESPFMKAGCGKTARPVCVADGGQRKSNRARLLRPDTCEIVEGNETHGGKGPARAEPARGGEVPDAEPGCLAAEPRAGERGGPPGCPNPVHGSAARCRRSRSLPAFRRQKRQAKYEEGLSALRVVLSLVIENTRANFACQPRAVTGGPSRLRCASLQNW